MGRASDRTSSSTDATAEAPAPRSRVAPASPARKATTPATTPARAKAARRPASATASAAILDATLAPPAKPEQLALALARPARVPTRPFRAELTVEQNSIFVANNYQGEHFIRETTVKDPITGEDVVRRMSVGKVHAKDRTRGVLRQIHQDCFYKVLELWGQQGYGLGVIRGKRYGVVRTSLYELVNAVFGPTDNARSYRRTRELLRDLQSIPIVLENVFTWAGLKDREEFTLLGDISWSERGIKANGEVSEGGRSLVTIVLSSMVTEGFQASHFKTLLGQPYDALGQGRGRRSEIARLLYPFLDTQLAEAEAYEVGLDVLAQRFGLQRYDYRSLRKAKFTPAIRALQGKPILEGDFTLHIELVQVPDDYILRATRVPGSELRPGASKALHALGRNAFARVSS